MTAAYTAALEAQLGMLRFVESGLGRAVLWLEGGGQVALRALQRAVLQQAEPFYWAPPICDLLGALAPPMPDWTLSADALPVPTAWWYFARPLPLPGDADAVEPLVALAYTREAGPAGTLQVLAYVGVPERAAGIPGPVVPWPLGAARSAAVQANVAADHARQGPADAVQVGWTRARVEALLRYLATGLVFLGERLLVAAPAAVDRAARRRVEREGPRLGLRRPPLVQVVQLRRTLAPAAPAGGAVAWTCRWLVRGHWRQQWYPSQRRHQPRYIAPYVKGPADKPLRLPGARVWAVVR